MRSEILKTYCDENDVTPKRLERSDMHKLWRLAADSDDKTFEKAVLLSQFNVNRLRYDKEWIDEVYGKKGLVDSNWKKMNDYRKFCVMAQYAILNESSNKKIDDFFMNVFLTREM